VDIAENVNRLSKNNQIKHEDDNIDRHNHFMEEAFSEPYPSMKHLFVFYLFI